MPIHPYPSHSPKKRKKGKKERKKERKKKKKEAPAQRVVWNTSKHVKIYMDVHT